MSEIVGSKTALGCIAESKTCPIEKMPPAMQASLLQFVREAAIRTLLFLKR